ncbi:hypothetical protein [Rhizobium sp. Rhizsp82]|uniref:hypothetical protein n=1 Tax=Rhizobium sp. Rhizsp82 TaxID=3243057 RepID=UPI0039B65B84
MQISKLDAARRQLLAAIHLNWFLTEPIATYQLAANAAELCDSLLVSMDKFRMKEHIRQVTGWSEQDIVALVNRPRNFTKHANRDPDAVMDDITHEDCDAVILTACLDYGIASGRSPLPVGVFLAWHSAVYPSKPDSLFSGLAKKLFPNLQQETREAQVRAARQYVAGPVDSWLLNDSRNELTDAWRWIDLRKHGQDFRTE